MRTDKCAPHALHKSPFCMCAPPSFSGYTPRLYELLLEILHMSGYVIEVKQNGAILTSVKT